MPSPTPSLLQQFSSEIAGRVAAAAPSTVSIATKDHMASGFFLQPGVVVTASEALDGDRGSEIEILCVAGKTRMTLAGRDPSTDIAILTGDAATGAALQLAADATIIAGEAAIVVGRSPHGVSCAVGFVSLAGAEWESMRGGRIDRRIRLDNRLERHQEGGPVLNAAGQCIGMAVLGPRRGTLVIPSATLQRISADLLQHGRIQHGYLGIAGQPIRPQPVGPATAQNGGAGTGLLVLSLDAGGPARLAGILQGDIITAVAGKPVGSPRQLRRSLGPDTVGRSVSCLLIRAGQPMTLDITVGEREPK